jgi:uncharacterized protein YabE (DUF348 family)
MDDQGKNKKPWNNLAVFVTAIAATLVLSLALVLVVRSADGIEVTILAPDRSLSVTSNARTVEELLSQTGIVVGPNDSVEPSLDTQLENGMKVTITWAKPVFLSFEGTTRPIFTTQESVSDVLKAASLELGPDDQVVPALQDNIPESGLIRIVRVTYDELTENVNLPFTTEHRDDTSLESGLTRVLQQGQNGVAQVTYLVRYEDGKEVSREEISKSVVKEPSPQVLLIGRLQQVARGGENIRFERAFEVKATAYCPCSKCCGPYATGNTAIGVVAKKGVIAVDPRVIPMGTRVYVDGYGFALAADTGSAIKGNKIDLCFDTHEEALRFGVKSLKVYVLE